MGTKFGASTTGNADCGRQAAFSMVAQLFETAGGDGGKETTDLVGAQVMPLEVAFVRCFIPG
ncbi:hypothetical protein [Streptomyces sp. 900105245]